MRIKNEYQYLFKGKHFAHIASINPDGSPQVTPVWVDLKDDLVLINTAKGRKKDRNLQLNSPVALSIQDSNDPYKYISIQGIVVDRILKNAETHIINLAQRYFGRDFKRAEDEVRIIIAIEPKYIHYG
ncbi:MAG: PPOX class F420-dependent oxidoreductase [Candidatus Heimdallarchaeota archaeon]|nr:PPOX class F420-dependent oxidoreductase [Candidatus Heimdallarchaeota archaeon]